MNGNLMLLAAGVCLCSSLAGAATIESRIDGTGVVNNPATSSPGTAFVLDFTTPPLSGPPTYQAVGLSFLFDCHTPYTALKIQLDGNSTVYTFGPTAPSTDQTAALIYDPAWLSGSGSVPAYVMSDEWRDELSDGRLQGRFWVEGTPFAPQWASLSGSASYLVPEPAATAALGLGYLLLRLEKNSIRSRRGRRKSPRQ
ncbi:MAG TPA: hypothetical protein VNA25_01150 [Phycisphaerae bacterium]|nr:hypothetical protein [Phycisphaerae bacterium]